MMGRAGPLIPAGPVALPRRARAEGGPVALAAVLVAIVTVLVGTILLGDVATPAASPAVRARLAGHLLLAAVGVVLLLVATVADSRKLTWITLLVLLGAGALGLLTLRLTGVRRRGAAARPEEGGDGRRPATAPPIAVVVVHGAVAALTILLVLLAALSA
jgi:hypothetical protein